MTKEGAKAPEFRLKGSDGREHSLKDAPGKYLVLYFYPRDLTPGCTIEANEFNKHLSELKKLNAIVYGVSNDDLDKHEKFKAKCDLRFPLLSDTKSRTIKAYGSWGSRGIFGDGTIRNTYLIKNGKIVKIFEKVNPVTHVNVVMKTLKDLQGI